MPALQGCGLHKNVIKDLCACVHIYMLVRVYTYVRESMCVYVYVCIYVRIYGTVTVTTVCIWMRVSMKLTHTHE